MIASYVAAKKPRAWIAPAAEVRELRDLVRHLAVLQEERQRHRNRLETASTEMVKASLEHLIVFLDQEIDELESRISDHIDRRPGIKADAELLASIPGLGPKTIAVILSELPNVANFTSAKSVAAYAGLSRKTVQSCAYKGATRLCKFGNVQLSDKCTMSAIGGCMRKLLAIAYGVLKTGTPFSMRA